MVERSAMTNRFTGVSDWPYATTWPTLTLRSTITPLRGAVTTIRVEASARLAISGRCSAVTPSVLRRPRSEEHTSELQSRPHLVCRLLLEKKKNSHCMYEQYSDD